jgi:hypothetical protein
LSVAVGDFNGDGKQDLAVANYANGTVTILLGKGDGTFSPGTSQTVGVNPSSVRIGDFNGDGQVDLAVTNTGSNTMTILLGKGDGTFTASAVSLPAYSYPWAIGVGDFNKDGMADLAVVNQKSNTVTVLTSQLTQTATAAATGISPVGQGQHLVDASYPGDSNYKSSISGTTGVTAVPPIGTTTPTMTVTPSAATITDLQTDTVTVTVAGGFGQATPTGTVTLSSSSYGAQQTLSSGSASFTIPAGTLAAGANTLSASYSGDGTFAAATGTSSVSVSQVVITTPAPSAVAAGSSATATVSFNAGSTYSGTMNLTCALTGSPSGAQSLPTCTVNPTTITLTAGGSGTTNLKVNTTAASTASLVWPARLKLWAAGSGGSILAFVLMIGVPSRRRRWLSMLVLLWMIVTAGAIGCGGGGASGGGQSPSSPNSPATPATTVGSYTFAVTGTDTSNAKITTSANVIINVQ